MAYLADLFAGAFLCNALPHLLSGLLGRPFPSPFARPRGVGDSSPPLNFVWGFANLLAGTYLLATHPRIFGFGIDAALAVLGAFLLGLWLSRHFGAVMRARGAADRAV